MRSDSGDALTSWLRGRASRPALVAALVVIAVSVQGAVCQADGGMDNQVVARAARIFLDGGSPYADKRFLYLPSSVLLAVPEAELGPAAVRVLAPILVAALVLLGWWAALRIFGVSARSRLAVGVAGGLAYFAPFRSELYLGNWTAVSAAALPVSLLYAARGRWTAAAAVIGAAVAVKPMLVPIALLFVLARQWRPLAVLAAIPLGASGLAGLAMTHPVLLFTRTFPFLLHGQDSFARPYDASLTAILGRLGLAQPASALLAGFLAAAGLWAARTRWRRPGGDERLRLVETATMLMLATFVVARPAFLHYVLVVLPLLLATLPLRGSLGHSPWFWIVLLPQNAAVGWPYLASAQRRAYKDALMLSGLALLLAWRILEPSLARRAPQRGAGNCASNRTHAGGPETTATAPSGR
ncbi:glycosyltransferase family 87 protein [Actinacidiphila acididurans]|uniref:DUF2029 domain-containing protein n=1 Tax=Actinacidiphila acididurans TaxID=2784346 RepID=A0ABS2TMK3_9ACTN|nr:glycosyltransferase family 87 protein [Actinacidiphila acididurans]MBM9504574.1 DUF2029 domain-containing protein [Actinacidiphila acididurans]